MIWTVTAEMYRGSSWWPGVIGLPTMPDSRTRHNDPWLIAISTTSELLNELHHQLERTVWSLITQKDRTFLYCISKENFSASTAISSLTKMRLDQCLSKIYNFGYRFEVCRRFSLLPSFFSPPLRKRKVIGVNDKLIHVKLISRITSLGQHWSRYLSLD